MHKLSRIVSAAVLSGSMLISAFPVNAAAEENKTDNYPTEKTETVYSFINPDGSNKETIVSSWIHDEDGITDIKEQIDLEDVENVKTDEKPTVSGDNYTWNVKGNDVYYQGKANKQLPVTLNIKYELDGQPVNPNDLDGKSGHLKMTINFKSNISKKINANGKEITIHPAYLSGGVLNLDNKIFENVKCSQSKTINDGSHEIVAFTSVPGLEETMNEAGLDKAAEKLPVGDQVVLETNVKKFEMPDLYVAMTNDFDLKEIDSVDNMLGQLDKATELFSAADQLESGSRKLADGTSQLKSGIAPLQSVPGQVGTLKSAFGQLDSGAGQLNAGLVQLDNGAGNLLAGVNQYTGGVNQLNGGISQLSQVDAGMKQLQNGLKKEQGIVDGAASLSNGIATLSDSISKANEQVQAIDVDSEFGKLEKPLQEAGVALEGLSTQLESSKAGLGQMQLVLEKDKMTLAGLTSSLEQAQTALAGLQATAQKIGAVEEQALTTVGKDNAIVAENKQINDANIKQFNDDKANAIAAIDASINQMITAQNEAAAKGETLDLSSQIASLQTQKANLVATSYQELGTLDSFDSVAQALQSAYGELNETLKGLNGSLTGASNTLTSLQNDLDSANAGLDQMSATLDSSKKTLEALSKQLASIKTSEDVANLKKEVVALQQGMNQLDAGAKQLNAGGVSLNAGIAQFATGLDELETKSSTAFNQLQAGSSQLAAKSDELNAGTKQIKDGTSQLKEGSNELKSGTSQLNASSSQLDQLSDGIASLTSAVDQLNSGADQLANGAAKFNAEGMKPLEEMLSLTKEEAKDFEDVINQIVDFNKEHDFYAGAPEGAKTTVKYIYKMEADETETKDKD